MRLRNHPLMFYKDRRNWPPVWIWSGTVSDEQPRGEVGSLHDIQILRVDHRIVLLMAYRGDHYIGCLRFDDAEAYQRIGAILKRQIGRSIKQIGDLDLSALPSVAVTPDVAAYGARRAARLEVPLGRRLRGELHVRKQH